ncbi:hypothetical protein IJT10_07340 [bacterium]|nr:hypothetical protein [bacterium]
MLQKILNYFKERWPYYGILILGIIFTTSVFFYHGRGLLDSDMSSEMILGKLLRDEGGIVSKNWCYSTEIRIISTQIVYKTFFYIFNDWHWVRTFSTAALLFILMGCYCFFTERMNLGKIGILSGLILLLPISAEYARFVIWGGYYLPHTAFIFLTLALAVRSDSPKTNNILLGFNILAAVLTGMGGVRQALILYIPFFITMIFLIIYYYLISDKEEKEVLPDITHLSKVSLIVLLSNFIGILINSKILSKSFIFIKYDNSKLCDFIPSFALDFAARSFGAMFGFTGCSRILNLEGVRTICAMLFCFTLLVVLCLVCREFKKLKFEYKFVTLFAVVDCVANVLFCTMSDKPTTRYMIPPFAMLLPVLAILAIRLQEKEHKLMQRCLVGIISVCVGVQLLVFMFHPTLDYYHSPSSGKHSFSYALHPVKNHNEPIGSHQQVTEWLVKNGYTKGLATLWQCNVATELSNGKLEMWKLYNHRKRSGDWTELKMDNWLQDRRHLTQDPEGKIFLLLTNQQARMDRNHFYADKDHLVYDRRGMKVYAYDSIDHLRSNLFSKNFLSKMRIRTGKKSKANKSNHFNLAPHATISGPGYNAPAGKYELIINCHIKNGKTLKGHVVGKGSGTILSFEIKDGKNKIPLELEEDISKLDINIKNDTSSEVEFKEIKMPKV